MYLSPAGIHFETLYLTVIILTGGITIFLGTILLYGFILTPLEHLEQKLIPNLMHLIRHDKMLRIGRILLFTFPLISFLASPIISLLQNVKTQDWFFLGWLILFAIALDIYRDSWRRLFNFLSPSFVVTQISDRAENAIQDDDRNLLLSELDSLAEIALRSVENSRLAMSSQIVQIFPPLLKTYLDSSKSISHTLRDIHAEKDVRGGDESSFIVFYLLQRFELINDRALRDRQETVCRQMVMMMGKIIVHCAQYDLSMVGFPVHFLAKFGLKAQQHHFEEVAVLTTSTLLEIAKTITTEIDVTYAELEEPFQAIINGLAAIARGTFKKQKNTSIKVLVQPFVDLKALFQTGKLASHRDTPIIVQQIDNVLEEFTALEQVMQMMPAIPSTEMETP